MVDLLARLHDLDDCRVDDVLPVILNLRRELLLLCSDRLLGVRDGHLDLDQVVVVVEVHLERVLHLELSGRRVLEQNLALAQRD